MIDVAIYVFFFNAFMLFIVKIIRCLTEEFVAENENNEGKQTTVESDECENSVVVSSFAVGSVVDIQIDWNDKNLDDKFQKSYENSLKNHYYHRSSDNTISNAFDDVVKSSAGALETTVDTIPSNCNDHTSATKAITLVVEQDTSTERKLKYKILSRPVCPTTSMAKALDGSSRVPPSVSKSGKDLRGKKRAKRMKTESSLDLKTHCKLKYEKYSKSILSTISIGGASVPSSRLPSSVRKMDKDVRVKKKMKNGNDLSLSLVEQTRLKYQELSRLASPTVSAEKSAVASFPLTPSARKTDYGLRSERKNYTLQTSAKMPSYTRDEKPRNKTQIAGLSRSLVTETT